MTIEAESGAGTTRAGWRARLDEPQTGTAKVVLWLTAIILAGALPLLQSLLPVTTAGRVIAYASHWSRLLPHLTGGVIAFAAGALAGAAVRGGRWAAGVGALVMATGLQFPALALALKRGPIEADLVPAHFTFHLGLLNGVYLGVMLLLAAAGGELAPALFRRVRIHVLAGAAWAWIIIGVVTAAVFWTGLSRAGFLRGPYTDWSAVDLAWRGLDNLPWLIGGLLLGVVVRQRLWAGLAGMAVIAALQVLSGQVAVFMGDAAHNAIALTAIAITRSTFGAIGVLVGAALAGARPWRAYAGPAMVVVLAVAAGMILVGMASGGSHEEGISTAMEPPVVSGEIVLLAKGKTVGALILTKQSTQPERVSYEWRYRTDGKGTFRAAEAGRYRSGTVREGKEVAFGPFSVTWSGRDDTSGYLYYPRFFEETMRADDLRICMTGERDWEKVDAFDPKWAFRASPSDRGGPLKR